MVERGGQKHKEAAEEHFKELDRAKARAGRPGLNAGPARHKPKAQWSPGQFALKYGAWPTDYS